MGWGRIHTSVPARTGVTDAYHHTDSLSGYWGSELGSFCLYGKRFPHSAISQLAGHPVLLPVFPEGHGNSSAPCRAFVAKPIMPWEADIQLGLLFFPCSLGWLTPALLSEKTRLNFAQPKPNFPEVCCFVCQPSSLQLLDC